MRTMSRDFRTLFGAGVLGGLTDGQLLVLFLARHEEAAFEEIVRRHGPMVWGVCRRVLRRHHDAEDAFQATFLVLARKGASVSPRERLGNWLYGVAVQTALKARTTIAKRTQRERQVTVMPEPMTNRRDVSDDLGPWLDRELSRLPEKYRVPIVLCDLEGETHKEAAGRLGWPIGTLSGRLSRARAILATRLNRGRGQRLSAGTLALVLAREARAASFPPSLAHSTARAATRIAAGGAVTELISAQVAALTEGVLTAMALSQVRVVTTGFLMAGLVGLSMSMQVKMAGALESQAKPSAAESLGEEQPRRLAPRTAGVPPALGAESLGEEQPRRVAPRTAGVPPALGAESLGEEQPRRVADQPTSPKADLQLLQGTWFGTVIESGGKLFRADAAGIPPRVKLIVNEERVFLRGPKFDKTVSFGTIEDTEMTLKLARTDNQGTIDLIGLSTRNGERPLVYRGIYSLTKGRFEVCLNIPGQNRPREFKTRSQTSQILIEFKPAVLSDDERKRPQLQRITPEVLRDDERKRPQQGITEQPRDQQ